MNIAETIEARIKAFLNRPIPPISLKHFVLLITALLAVGSIGGLYFPITAWLFIITFILLGSVALLFYFQGKEEST